MILREVRAQLEAMADPEQALFLQRYFKTGPGEYGEGDRFRGIRVPALRRLAAAARSVTVNDALELLQSGWHEDRLLALLILGLRYRKTDAADRSVIYESYLRNTRFINNWDLVDASAEYIVGAHLFDDDHERLQLLAHSPLLWERRIAIMATFHFIRRGRFETTLRLAEQLLNDREDLIHKAVGWMLREVGKRNLEAERAFLDAHSRQMPRTMLRYAIERFPEELRRHYMKKKI